MLTQDILTQKYLTENTDLLPLLPDLKAWWNGSNVVVNTSNKISKLIDLSGNGYDLIQDTELVKPTLVKRGWVSSIDTIQFTGTELMQVGWVSDIVQPFTVHIIWKMDSITTEYIFDNGITNSLYMRYFFGLDVNGIFSFYNKTSLTNYKLNSFVFNGTSTKVYENGRHIATGNGSTTASNGFTLGNEKTGGVNGLIGQVLDVMIVDNISTTRDFYYITKYLCKKNYLCSC